MHIRLEQISVFVIDSYTGRILARLGLTTDKPGFTALQALFMDNLPHDEKATSTMPSSSGTAKRRVSGLPYAITAA